MQALLALNWQFKSNGDLIKEAMITKTLLVLNISQCYTHANFIETSKLVTRKCHRVKTNILPQNAPKFLAFSLKSRPNL